MRSQGGSPRRASEAPVGQGTEREAIGSPRSVAEAVDALTRRGYASDFRATPEATLRESGSGECFAPEALEVEGLYRFEGVSDPDDQTIVFALRSADDRVRGTYTVPFGPVMGAHDAEVVRRLRDPSRPRTRRGP